MAFEIVRVRMANGTEYGPVEASVLVQWMGEGRIPRDAVLIDQFTGQMRPAFAPVSIPPALAPPPIVTSSIPVAEASVIPKPTPDFATRYLIAAEYWQIIYSLKGAYIAAFFWAFVNIVLGIVNNASYGVPAGAMQIIIGILMIVDGACIAGIMKPKVLVFDGVVFLICALWNIILGIAVTLHDPSGLIPLALGGFQIYWGVESIVKSKKMTNKLTNLPPDQLIASIGKEIQEMKKVDPRLTPDVFSFKSTTAFQYLSWRGKLHEELVLLVNDGGVGFGVNAIKVVQRSNLRIEVAGNAEVNGNIRARLILGGNTLIGTIDQQSLRKLSVWINNITAGAPA